MDLSDEYKPPPLNEHNWRQCYECEQKFYDHKEIAKHIRLTNHNRFYVVSETLVKD